jgi:MFS family permease
MAPMVVAPLAGLVLDRIGARTLITAGQIFLATALAWIALITTVDVSYGSYVAPFVLAGVGMGLTLAPSAGVVMGSFTDADRGVASGTSNTIREVGVAMGVALLASVFASAGSYASPSQYVDGLVLAVWVGAAIVAVGAVAALLLPGRRG